MSALHDALHAITDAAILAEQTAADADLPDLVELAALVYDTQQVVKFIADTVGAELLAIDIIEGADHPYAIPSGGTLVRRTTAKRKDYDQDRVIGVFKSRLAESVCTGEADSTPVGVLTASGERVPVLELVGPVVDAAVGFCGAGTPSFNSWRATPAKALGINLSDYCEWTDGKAYISIEGRNPVIRAGESVLS